MKTLSAIRLGLVMLAASGCASVGPPAPGTWVATNPSLVSGAIEMTIKQTGSQYTGNLLITGTATDPSGFTQGVVSGHEVRVLQPTSLTGRLTAQEDSMSGILDGLVAANVSLERQK